jgi:hypothetical protein
LSETVRDARFEVFGGTMSEYASICRTTGAACNRDTFDKNKIMPRHPYCPADLPPLAGALRALEPGLGSEIRLAAQAFNLLASATDIPPPLHRYYEKVGKKLTLTAKRLSQNVNSAVGDGWKLTMRIDSALGRLPLTEEELERLRHVNNRLLELEKSLKQMVDGLRQRLEGLDPSGLESDEWDGVDIILWVNISAAPERPAYDPDTWSETGILEPIEIRAKIFAAWKRDTREETRPWGLNDGQNHSDLSGCEGHPLQHFSQSYLFHELFDHANAGLWGMLHLQSLWIEIIPHRSANFQI